MSAPTAPTAPTDHDIKQLSDQLLPKVRPDRYVGQLAVAAHKLSDLSRVLDRFEREAEGGLGECAAYQALQPEVMAAVIELIAYVGKLWFSPRELYERTSTLWSDEDWAAVERAAEEQGP